MTDLFSSVCLWWLLFMFGPLVALTSPSAAGLRLVVPCSIGYKTGQENLLWCWSEADVGFLGFVPLLNSSSNFLTSSLRPHFAAPEHSSLVVWVASSPGAIGALPSAWVPCALVCHSSAPCSSLGSCVTCKASRRLASSVSRVPDLCICEKVIKHAMKCCCVRGSLSGLPDVFYPPCRGVQNVSSLSSEWVLPGPHPGGGRRRIGEANMLYLLGEILWLWVLLGCFFQGYPGVMGGARALAGKGDKMKVRR